MVLPKKASFTKIKQESGSKQIKKDIHVPNSFYQTIEKKNVQFMDWKERLRKQILLKQ